MNSNFFYRLCLIDANRRPRKFLGCAFAVTPDGSLLTCKHVINIEIPTGLALAVLVSGTTDAIPIGAAPVYSANTAMDLALLPNALAGREVHFFPLLTPSKITYGMDVWTYGRFSVGRTNSVDDGYFAGKIINAGLPLYALRQMKLPFAVLEGLSGSPIVTYHNGSKVVGIAIGNSVSRILASETIEYQDETVDYRETINRIVEFGVAYHGSVIEAFLTELGVGGYVVSHGRLNIAGTE